MADKKDLEGLLKSGMIKKGNDQSLVLKRFPTGIPSLDILLGGGVPIGRCIETYGPESTGKTLLAQYITTAVQKTSRPLALMLDLEQGYDEAWWQQSGVDTSQLLVSNPATAEETIDIMVAMVNSSEELGLIILDGIPAMIPAVIADPEHSAEKHNIADRARLVTLMYSKLVHVINEKGITLLATNQMRDNIGGYDELAALPGGKAQRHFNQIILRTRREGWIKEGKDNVGFYMEIISKKNKTSSVPDGTSIILPFMAAGQIDMLTAYLEDGIKVGVIGKKSPYFHWASKNYLGMANLRTFFSTNPEELEELKRLTSIAT